MRISTSQAYGSGLRGIERSQNQLLRLQNQMSSGRRMLTSADDPVAAARALTVSQSKDVGVQYAHHQSDATARLGLVDNQLTALTNLLQNVRERVIQAGNTVLSDSDRQALAIDLASSFDSLLGIANSQSAEGDYLFSGYQGATIPFAGSATSSVTYAGDDGQRLLQVTSTQQIPSNVAGSDLFMNIREGNGTFSTAATGSGGFPNQGSGIVQPGSVLDLEKWQSALNSGFPWQGTGNFSLQVQFSSVAGVSSYQLFDASTPDSSGTPLPAQAVSPVLPFVSGQAIPLVTTIPDVDFGAQVVINGLPAAGDTFTIKPSANKSVFQTMQELIGLLSSPLLASGTTRTDFSGQLQGHLTNLDQVLVNVSRVHTTVGGYLQELDGLSSNSEALDIQYAQTLSDLQDLDYAKAITDFTMQQVNLEAAQKSFVQISDLNLFKYL